MAAGAGKLNVDGSPRKAGLVLAGIVFGAVVVFSLGVMVGKRVAESTPRSFPPPAALPSENIVPNSFPPPPAAPETASPGKAVDEDVIAPEKMTFYEALSEEGEASPPPLPEPSRSASVPPPPLPVKSAAQESVSFPPPAAAPPIIASPPPVEKKKLSRDESALRIKELMGEGAYAIQVSSSTNREWAKELIRRLSRRGLDAVSSEGTVSGKTWYRVRVGPFPNREDAKKAIELFKGLKLDGMVVRSG